MCAARAQRGGETALYGAYRLVMRARLGRADARRNCKPAHALRMLNHWDNMDGRSSGIRARIAVFLRGYLRTMRHGCAPTRGCSAPGA